MRYIFYIALVVVYCYIEVMDDFTIHACEQVLRFSSVSNWNDLSEQLKVQLGFNMGVLCHSLNLSKEDGYQFLSDVREDVITLQKFHDNIKSLVEIHAIAVNSENISRPF